MVASYPGLVATLILKGRRCSLELFGKEPLETVIPYNKEKLDALLMFDENWQIAIGNYFGQILHHLPSHALSVINHLNVDTQGQTTMMRQWIPKGAMTWPLKRPPYWRVKRAKCVANLWAKVCLYFSTRHRFSYLDTGQTDSSCHSPPGTRFPRHLDHKRGRTLLCPCLHHPLGESSRL